MHPQSELAELLEPVQREDGSWIEPGFMFNGLSAPQITWSLGYYPFHPKVIRTACIHDDDYERKIGLRRISDERMQSNLLADGVDPEVALAMFIVVRECGASVWMDEEDIAERDRRVQQERRRVEEAP
jgi:hypothetical protein